MIHKDKEKFLMDEEKEVTEESSEIKTEEVDACAAEGKTSSEASTVEEIDTASKPAAVKSSAKPVTAHKREEPPPNPLLLDPYEWEVR